MTNYSNSKCPKCENSTFELVKDTPESSRFKMFYIRCIKCKTVIGTHDYDNVAVMVEKIMRHLDIR